MRDPLARSATSLLADLRAGSLSAVELVEACLDRIAALEPDIQAWAYLDRNLALAQAQAADARRVRRKARPAEWAAGRRQGYYRHCRYAHRIQQPDLSWPTTTERCDAGR